MTIPSDGRRFDDDEVSLILRRAGELQESRQEGADGGMSLTDLEAVAREAGLDPALVRQAAAELPVPGQRPLPSGAGERFLGAPTMLRYERVVDGELPPSEYDLLVEEIRRATNDVGTLSTLGRTLAWSSSSSLQHGRGASRRAVSVTVVARGGRTAIRVEERVTGLAGGLFGGLMGGLGGGSGGAAMGIGFAVFHSAVAALGLWGAIIAGSYGLARTIFTTVVRRRAGELSSLADRLAALVESLQPGPRSGSP
jgi:hypothetical protein